jgi:hypothetical protein
LILPIAVAVIFAALRLVVPPFARLGDYYTFICLPKCRSMKLAASDQTTGSRFQIFDWGGFAGSNRFVIYDDSDQIALAEGTRNLNNLAGGLAEDCSARVFRAIGHYYLCGD